MKSKSNNKFLTAKWLNLAMINYKIDPLILAPYIPQGTELDQWNGDTYVSIVGLHFLDTKVKGFSIPFHRNFEEINLRFYVKRNDETGWKRGVVFIKEIVPRAAIALVAKYCYNEKYVSMPMKHSIDVSPNSANRHVCYKWKCKDRWNHVTVVPDGNKRPLIDGTEEEFIAEHYWGYSSQKDGSTIEYQVQHPRWNIWQVSNPEVDIDIHTVYGKEFEETLSQKPSSAFLAEGSEVTVFQGVKI